VSELVRMFSGLRARKEWDDERVKEKTGEKTLKEKGKGQSSQVKDWIVLSRL
jgi:hypothetical protein